MKKIIISVLMLVLMSGSAAMADSSGIKQDDTTAKLYVFRGAIKLNASLLDAWVYVDGMKYGELRSHEYIVIPLAPGRHEVALRSDENYKKDTQTFTVKAGDRVYYEAGRTSGRLVTAFLLPVADVAISKAFTLKKINAKSFEKKLPRLKQVEAVSYVQPSDAVAEGKQNIYFYRPRIGELGKGVETALIYINGQKVAALDDRQYVVIPVQPGENTIGIRTPSTARKTEVKIEVGEGENTYIDLNANTAYAPTVAVVPLLSMGVSKAYALNKTDRDAFESKKAEMGRIRPLKLDEKKNAH